VISLPTSFSDGIRYYDAGPVNKPAGTQCTFVLLHGLGNSLAFWSAVAPNLTLSARTLALDIPGFGQSRPPRGNFSLESVAKETLNFLRTSAIRDATIVGHSLGAIISMEMARQDHDIVRDLVLVDGTLVTANKVMNNLVTAVRHPSITAHVIAQFIGGLIPITVRVLDALQNSKWVRLGTLWPFVASPSSVCTELLRHALADNTTSGVLSTLRTVHGLEMETLMAQIRQPVKLVWGLEDRLILSEDIETSRHLLNVIEEVPLPQCGQWPMIAFPNHLIRHLTTD